MKGWTTKALAEKGFDTKGRRSKRSAAEAFQFGCEVNGLPVPEAEYEFSHRNYRADYAWPDWGLLLEVEGGVWTSGRHTRASGFVGDMAKYNLAACYGYRLIRVVPDDLFSGATFDLIRRALYA